MRFPVLLVKKAFSIGLLNRKLASDNFYKTTSDLRLATANLYGGSPWGIWHHEAFLPLGDILSGNGNRQWISEWVQLYTRTITAGNPVLQGGWKGLYNLSANAMVLSIL